MTQALTRRVNAGAPVVTGLDDPSAILDAPPNFSTGSPPRASLVSVLDLVVSSLFHPFPMKPDKETLNFDRLLHQFVLQL